MDEDDDHQPLHNPTAVAKAKGAFRKNVIACTMTVVLIASTFTVLLTQPSSPEMDMYAAMDWTADPCEDFYQYACGTWIATNSLPPDRSTFMRSFSTATERNMAVVTGIVLDETNNPFSKIGDYYSACMNVAALDQLGAQPVQPYLKMVQGTTWNDTLVSAARLQLLGFSMFWGFSVEPDEVNNTQNLFEIRQGGLTLPLQLYLQTNNSGTVTILQQYTQHISTIFNLAAVPNPDAQAANVLAFETALANCTLNPNLLLNPFASFSPMTIPQLEALSPNIPWQPWFATIFGNTPLPPLLNVVAPSFFTNVSALIGGNNPALSVQNMQSYMLWKILEPSSIHLSEAFMDAHFNFFGIILNGAQAPPPRQQVCVERTHAALTDLVVAKFLALEYDPNTVKIAEELVQQLIASFKARLQNITWMDDSTKANATLKLEAIVPMVAGPSTAELRNYSTVDINQNDLYGNWIRINTNDIQLNLQKLGQVPDRTKWHMAADEVNAYYDPTSNTIVFPIGILEPTFFFTDARPSMNYGGVGSVIGHEMTHGFDNEGRLFDAQGNLDNWWSPQSAANFVERTQCVINYYTQLGGNGQMSLTENLADMGGVKTAYGGFQQRSALFSPYTAQSPLTPEQMFFVAFAQNWCALQTPQAAQMQILTDVHSLPQFRVQGPLANFDAFAQAFNCPVNSTYNPVNRCGVW